MLMTPAMLATLVLFLLSPLVLPLDFAQSLARAARGLKRIQKPERRVWEDYIHMKGSSMPSPDPQIGAAALKSADTGEAWLNFAKDAYASFQKRQEGIDKVTTDVATQQLDTAKQQSEWAQQDRATWDKYFAPILTGVANDAATYDSPEKQAEAAAEAKSDIQKQVASERQASLRQMSSLGVNPASGRGLGIARATDLGTALASAGAQNTARQQVRDKGLALRGSAVGIGGGLLGQSNASTGLSINAGNSATGNLNSAAGTAIGSTGVMSQGYAGAQQGYGQQANILNNLYQSQLAGWQAQQQQESSAWGGIGQAVGLGLSFFAPSSKKLKKNKRKMPDGAGLDAVRQMPVEKWQYKPGVADGGEHVGPYAEDMAKATGIGDGKTIAFQDAIGITMKAVQDLDKKVDKIARAVGLSGVQRKPAPKSAAKTTPTKKAA